MQKFSLRHVLFFLAGAGLASAAGCFNGSDASGQPCERDEQCGVGQTCNVDGYCDQTPDGDLCGNGILDEFRGEECDDGAANAEDGACRPDCTLPSPCGNELLDAGEECDKGSANADNAACKSDCTDQVCGDGFVGPGEACDAGVPGGDDQCSAACALISCGDGELDPGEECDDGETGSESCTTLCTMSVCGDGIINTLAGEGCDIGEPGAESADCNVDCTTASCGDGLLNVTSGELCDDADDNIELADLVLDNDADVINDVRCTTDCERLFYYNGGNDNNSMNKNGPPNPNMFMNEWTAAPVPLSMGNSVWWTGAPPDGTEGVAVMRTPSIRGDDPPNGADEQIYLQFRHQWLYPNCSELPPLYPATSNGDGGNVKLDNLEGGDPPQLENFVNGDDLNYTLEQLGDEGLCEDKQNPLANQFGYVRQNAGADLPENWSSALYRIDTKIDSLEDGFGLVFEAGFDCDGLCIAGLAAEDKTGWFVDDIIVIGRSPDAN